MGEIVCKNVCKSFGKTEVLKDFNLTIKDGSFTVLVGPSGCGKTTLLRAIAGIGPATGGNIYMDGVDITHMPPGKRNVAMVFQNYAIYPTMSVQENIEFGLKNKKVPKEERKRLIEEVAETVGLAPYLKRKPSELSGGQRQRVALARAMVKKPAVFLMDEPLSNLDAKLRGTMRSELIELHQQLKTTFIYVTHDQTEAMSMADQIVLINGGKIMQNDTPVNIYMNPNNVFTAQFTGTPPMNILSGDEKERKIGVRPEKVILSRTPIKTGFCEKADILTREMLGAETIYKLRTEKENQLMVKTAEPEFFAGEKVYVGAEEKNLYYFDMNGERIRNTCDDVLPLGGIIA